MPGLISGESDLMILILFALRKLGFPATLETIAELTMSAPGLRSVTYFDVASCADSLVKTGHLELSGEEFSLTERGIRNGEATETDIPFSVRQHTESSALEERAKSERRSLIKTSRAIRRDGGYSVELSLSDGKNEILFLRVAAASEAQAEKTERTFLERAERVFGAIIGELSD
ncbi:MAG: DUF4364 family protein [Oscillospiraceae bacterium]|jgi:hypothetical protein|nr:DUF4364 family protein [Oscillospiraceae bacterium]